MAFETPEQVEAYDRWYATPLGQWVDRLEKQAVFELLPPLNGLRILEAGCGTGSFTLDLAAQGARVVGMDRSAAMLSRARSQSPGAT